jgi:hypothetical protein
MPVNPKLEEILAAKPDETVSVVITLARGAETEVAALGLVGAAEVAPGILSASLSAAEIRALGERREVEGIDFDEPVHALS